MVKTVLSIEGMACSMCESHMNECIRKNFDVKSVKSSHKKKSSEIISENALDAEKLKAVIKDTGYELKGISSEPYVKKGLFHR